MALTKVSRGLLSTGIVDNSDATAITIDSSERIGVGTTTPVSLIDATGAPVATSGSIIRVRNSSATSSNTSFGGVLFTSSPGTDYSIGKSNVNASTSLSFRNGNTGASLMDLDSSGNLLVGKTSVGLNTAGFETASSGRTRITRDNQNVVEVNRKSSNGSLITFNKDGTSFGSLQVLNNDNLAIMGSVADHGGIQFATHSMVPMEAGVDADGTVDLGSSSARWKDLYLSGGAYLGGTGSDNFLDDYEEGTWTPTYTATGTNPSSVTYNIQVGRYIKIGHQVVAQCRIRTNGSLTQGSGALYVSGLPFNSKSVTQLFGGAIIHYTQNWADNNAPSRAYQNANESRIVLVKYDSDDPRQEGSTSVDAGSLATGSNSNDVICTIIYSSV